MEITILYSGYIGDCMGFRFQGWALGFRVWGLESEALKVAVI